MILVTGATGHLGNVILSELVHTKQEVRAFVLPNDDVSHIKDLNADIFYGNVLDQKSVDLAIKGCEYIIHTAALVSIGNTFNATDIYNVNVQGLKNVLDSAKQHHVKKVVYVSSIHAFNELKKSLIITEDTQKNPKLHFIPYAKSKALALEVVKEAREGGLLIDVLFPTGIIGPFDYKKGNNALYPIRKFLSVNNKKTFYFNAGYDFVDVRDVAKITIKMLSRKKTNNEYIISGEYISLKKIYTTLKEYTKKNVKLVKVPNIFLIIGIHIYYFFMKLFRKKAPITPQAFKILTSKHKPCSNKARLELDFEPRDIRVSLIDSVKFIKADQT